MKIGGKRGGVNARGEFRQQLQAMYLASTKKNVEKKVKASTAFSLKNEPFLDNDSLKLLEAADFSSLTHL